MPRGQPLDRAGRHDGGGQVVDRSSARRAAGRAVRRCRCRDRKGRRHEHRRYFCPPWRSRFPQRRGPRHRPPARRRPAGAGDRRRRGHERRHPRGDQGQRRVDLAQRGARRADAADQQTQERSADAANRRPGGDLARIAGRARAGLCPGRHHRAVARSAARRDRIRNHDSAGRVPQCAGSAAARGQRMTALVRNDPTIVNVALGARSYDIVIGRGLLASLGARIAALRPGAKAVIVTDDNVARHHLEPAEAALRHAGVASSRVVVPPGEASKSYRVFEQVCEAVIASRIERGDLAIALGGGVIGDLTGFVASVVRRGLDYVQVPTTLLADVDSSVGGKTAIDSAHGKNLIGAFHQPILVLADTALLDTLPEREFRAGYAELVKYGLLGDADFFAWLENNWRDVFSGGPARDHAIAESCRAKATIVARDERETGDRALLNLGHTFGHALEAACGFSDRLLHGEAISAGMALAFEFSARRQGLLPMAQAQRAIRHLAEVGLPTRLRDIPGPLPSVDQLMDLIAQDKKVKRGMLTFILVRGIGSAFIEAGVDAREVRVFLSEKLAER